MHWSLVRVEFIATREADSGRSEGAFLAPSLRLAEVAGGSPRLGVARCWPSRTATRLPVQLSAVRGLNTKT